MVAADRWSVLVVESDEAVRSTVVEGLRDSGLAVAATDGLDGSLDAWRGDVIVTDSFAMPYSAKSVVAYLKDLRSRFAGAGLVVLTGHNGASVDAAHLPADAVVMKPFDLEHLIDVVIAVARERRKAQRRSALMSLATIRPLMKKQRIAGRERPPAQPIALVCVSPHKRAGPQAKEPDKLTMVRGKWAWCPSGAVGGHDWQRVASGSLNALRVQLAEVSRLVDVALNANGASKKARKTTKKQGARRGA